MIGRHARRHATLAILAGLAVAACDRQKSATMTLPDPPAPIASFADSPFGDSAASSDERLAGSVDRLLRPLYGKPREQHLAAPQDTDIAKLQAWYAAQAKGWQPLPQVADTARRAGGEGFGFVRDKQAFVVLLAPRATGELRPVTVQRYGD